METNNQPRHPLVAYRERHGLSRLALAKRTGIGYSTLKFCEYGVVQRLAPQILDVLVADGADPVDAQRQHEAFCQSLRGPIPKGPER